METPEQKGHKVLTIFFLMAFIFSFSSFAYKIVDYEDFSYTALNASDLDDHGWIVDVSSGIFNNSLDYCFVIGGVMSCSPAQAESIGHKFNNVPGGYCMTPTGLYTDVRHHNFSIRIDVLADGGTYGLDSITYISNALESSGKFSRIDSIKAAINTNLTGGGATPYRFYWDTPASPFQLIKNIALDAAWHTIQIDFIVANESTPPESFVASGGNITVDSSFGSYSVYTTNTWDCINVTSIRFSSTGQVMDFDNLIVIEYADNEPFLSPSEELSYSTNTLPYFDIDIRNHLGRSTNAVEINKNMTIRPYNVLDFEGNDAYYACVCDFTEDRIFSEFFSDTNENIRNKYSICGNNTVVFYNEAFMFQFPLLNNCTSPFIADMGVNTEDSIFYIDSTIPYNSELNLEFFDSSNVKRIDLAFRYNSSTEEFYIYKDSVKIDSLLNFVYDEAYNFRVIFDFTNSRFQFGIFNSTYPINDNPVYYSSWHSFTKAYGIRYMRIYPTTAENELIGNIIYEKITLPSSLDLYTNTSFITCLPDSYFEYESACFLNDEINTESLFNFKTLVYTTRPLGNYSAPTGSATESLIFQLFPSEYWKVFFGIFLVSIVTILIMLSGMPFAWGVAIVADSFIILSLSLIGLLPSWIPIFMAFIITFVVASFIRNSMVTGGSD
jgi:hypothetical protein